MSYSQQQNNQHIFNFLKRQKGHKKCKCWFKPIQYMSSKDKSKGKLQNSFFFKAIKRLLFQQSHLTPYLPFIKQGLANKMIRLHQDQAYKKSELQSIGSHDRQHKQSDRQFLYRLVFSEKQCYNPIGNWLLLQYALVFVAIMYSYVETGIILVYGYLAWTDIHTNPVTIAITSFCILIFILDIAIQFKTGFLFRGVIITQKRRVVSKYLRSYFLPDVLLVVVLMAALISSDFYINVVKIITISKFMRMFQFDQFYLRRIAADKFKKVIYVILKQFITIFVLSHTIGIVFYTIDLALTNDPICINNNSLCWLYSSTTYSPILNYGWNIQYFYSVYWGVNTITTISYGDIAPNNPYETIYALFFFCFGFIVYGYVVNNIIRVILWSRQASDNFKHDLIIFTTYMDILKIGRKAQYQVRDLLHTHFLEQNQRDTSLEDQMKTRLPQDLRDKLVKDAYYKVHEHLGLILVESPSVVKLLYFLQEKKYSENEVIFQQGAVLTQLCYLFKGEVELACLFGRNVQHITNIDTQDTFLGHYEFFLNERAAYSLTPTKTTTLYFISKGYIEDQAGKFTDLKENFKILEYQLRHKQNYKKIFYRCFFCRLDHHWYQCRDHFPLFNVTLNTQPHHTKGTRIAKPSYQTWKDKSKLSVFQKINKTPILTVLQKMQERIYSLRKMKRDMRNSFDVDVGYDWQYYLPQFNISVFKLEWKKQQSKKESANHSMGELQRLFSLVQSFQ